MADEISLTRSGSSSSSYAVGGVIVCMIPTIPEERLVNPNCTCGSPSSLRISWTDMNQGRRFFKCNRCNFFMWVDPKVNWYNHVVRFLLRKNSVLATDVVDMRHQIIAYERNNRKLQEGLDEYLIKIEEHGNSVADLKTEVEGMKSSRKMYKRVIGTLVAVVVVLLMK